MANVDTKKYFIGELLDIVTVDRCHTQVTGFYRGGVITRSLGKVRWADIQSWELPGSHKLTANHYEGFHLLNKGSQLAVMRADLHSKRR